MDVGVAQAEVAASPRRLGHQRRALCHPNTTARNLINGSQCGGSVPLPPRMRLNQPAELAGAAGKLDSYEPAFP
jgi:hypothetical protein